MDRLNHREIMANGAPISTLWETYVVMGLQDAATPVVLQRDVAESRVSATFSKDSPCVGTRLDDAVGVKPASTNGPDGTLNSCISHRDFPRSHEDYDLYVYSQQWERNESCKGSRAQ